MKILKLSTLLLLLLLFACNHNFNSNEINNINQLKKCFPKELTSHIPNVDKNTIIFGLEISYPEGCYGENWCGIRLLLKMEATEFHEYVDYLDKNYTVKYNFKEKCLYYINDNKGERKPFNAPKCDTIDNLKLPVTNFQYCIEKEQDSSFYNSSIIHVVSAKKGRFIKKDYLTKGVGLSNEWKNGYSKGVLVNEKNQEVYLWLEVW